MVIPNDIQRVLLQAYVSLRGKVMNIRQYMKLKKESAEETENNTMTEDINKEYAQRLKKHRTTIALGTIILVIILLAGGAAFYSYSISMQYDGVQIVKSVDRADAETAQYVPYAQGMLKYSNDGAAYIGADLSEKWNQTYQMQEPVYAICESAVALADKNGTEIYILNGSGLQAEINTLLPIKKLAVSAQGLTAASLEDSGKGWVKIYSPTMPDTVLAETKILMEESGYPVAMCLSNDGIKFGISHLSVEGGESKSTLAFHNLGSVGENEIDNFVGSTSYVGTVFPVFEYINSDTAVAYGTDRIEVFTGRQIPELAYEVVLEEEIVKIAHDSQHIGVMVKNTKDSGKYRLDIYDLKGKKIFSKGIDRDYTQMQIANDMILLYNEGECCIYNMQGVLKFQKSLSKTILSMAILEKNLYMVVTEDKIELIKLVR